MNNSEDIRNQEVKQEVKNLRECAMTIFKNAYSIVGNEENRGDLEVTIHLSVNERPRINIYRDIYPKHVE